MDTWTEYENVMKKGLSYQQLGQYYQAEQYIRDHIGRYLDDQFKLFDHLAKSTICFNASSFYRQMGFKRKASFYDRLGVLFRLHVVDSTPRTAADYKLVYPTLLKTLPGYGIGDPDLPLESCPPTGPVQLQIRVLNELYTASNRAELPVVAIRHSCHLLQLYYDVLEEAVRDRLISDVRNLLQAVGGKHSLAESVSAGSSNILLPPIQLTRFPIIREARINRLSSALEPTIINLDEEHRPVIWIVSQFEKKKDDEICWVVDCPVQVSIEVSNCLPYELIVRNLQLLVEGCEMEAVPIHLTLSPSTSQPITVELGGIPRSAGHLTVVGYSCEVFGLHNVCRLPNNSKMKVRVLPSLPLLRLDSSLTRSLIAGMDDESREEKLYAGQSFEHSLTLLNDSKLLTVRSATLSVQQPKVCGTPLIEMLNTKDEDDNDLWQQSDVELGPFLPGESKQIRLRVFGLDPTRTALDGVQEESVAESALPLLDAAAETSSLAQLQSQDSQHDLIPFHGRLLSCSFIVTYECDIEGDEAQRVRRRCRLPLAVTILPAVRLKAYHVLAGDSSFSRYIVVDVSNETEHDAELEYCGVRKMHVLPRETCRVPILCPCCTDVEGGAAAFTEAMERHRNNPQMQKEEVERLRLMLERHVTKHLDIRWEIASQQLSGIVPMGALLSEVSFLKQLILPTLTLELCVGGRPYVSADEIPLRVGEVTQLHIKMISSLNDRISGTMSLECEQEISTGLGLINKNDHLLLLGAKRQPFAIDARCSSCSQPSTSLTFEFLFRVEGIFKITAQVASDTPLRDDDVFGCVLSFAVASKAH